jgi:hypothetical protein
MEQVVVELGSSHQSIIVRAGAIKASLKDARLLVQRFAEELDGLFEAGFDKQTRREAFFSSFVLLSVSVSQWSRASDSAVCELSSLSCNVSAKRTIAAARRLCCTRGAEQINVRLWRSQGGFISHEDL